MPQTPAEILASPDPQWFVSQFEEAWQSIVRKEGGIL